jgi:hypothetical protein
MQMLYQKEGLQNKIIACQYAVLHLFSLQSITLYDHVFLLLAVGNESLQETIIDNGVGAVNLATSKNLTVKSRMFPHCLGNF